MKDGKKEISAIIVPTDAEGFTVIDNYEKMGLNASNTTELVFENVRVPKENLLGERGNGFKQFLSNIRRWKNWNRCNGSRDCAGGI